MEELKGTVTPLSSLFPVEEAQKATQRVHDTIGQHQRELDQLWDFINDNTNLINLVKKLPDELHHDIMVPFGKAAFFPGRLIHTNEFLVLLGEGYYAERTSKQTAEILKRRGKALESQVESLNAVMQDLKAEASFFDATAAESAEGMVEISEEYIEGTSAEKVSELGVTKSDPHNVSEAGNPKAVVEDEEDARIAARMDELEKLELAAGSDNELGEDEECTSVMSRIDELKLAAESLSEHTKADLDHYTNQHSLDKKQRISEEYQMSNPMSPSKDESTVSKECSRNHIFQEDLGYQPEDLKVQSLPQDNSSSYGSSALKKSSSAEKPRILPEVKGNFQQESQSRFNAFTGSIVERTDNLELNSREQLTAPSKSAAPQTTKPVSRFKMQRR